MPPTCTASTFDAEKTCKNSEIFMKFAQTTLSRVPFADLARVEATNCANRQPAIACNINPVSHAQ